MSSTAAPAERESVRAARDTGHVDVLVIGGGFNGISTFRDLAMQGVDVLLVERGDTDRASPMSTAKHSWMLAST